ncbi:MAG TPA: endonuclease MutS2 [Fimbriimonadaceae bacterium]|nr:endonuclease MutS2 [Fimbriimonadaceae bacterium]
MSHAFKVLEFGAILEQLGRHCETELGTRFASELQPTFEEDVVWAELASTQEAHDVLSRGNPPSLRPIRDLGAHLTRAEKGGALGSLELYQIADSMQTMRALKNYLSTRRSESSRLWQHAEALPEAKKVEDSVFQAVDMNGHVLDSASPELGRLRARARTMTARIQERIQSYVSGRTRELLSDPIYTVRDGRYVIPVKAENRGKIKGIVHDTSGSGQTLFIEPEEVLQLGNQLREAEAAERDEVGRILSKLSASVGEVGRDLRYGLEAAAWIDFLFAKAKLGFAMKASMPVRSQGHGIRIQNGRHPLLEADSAIPLNLSVGFEEQGVLITGPNTGGKTVAIKTVGLFVLMAQSGLMLPATHVRLGTFTQVWADIGDEQSLQQSLSTFSGHIKNIAAALSELKPGALVLLDEVGAGTDPAEGAALAKAVLLTLKEKGARVLASTHYGELKAFAYNSEGFSNAAMEFDQRTLKPTYRLVMGAPGASHALKIAERYGIPRHVIEVAKEALGAGQQEVSGMLEKLEQAQRQARTAQGEADRRAAELKRAEEVAQRKLAEADEIRRTVHAKASEAIEAAIREIRLEAQQVFEELKQASDDKALAGARARLKDLESVAHEFVEDARPKAKNQKAEGLRKGASVRVEGHTQVGTLLTDPGQSPATVQIGVLKFTVPITAVQLAESPKSAALRRTPTMDLHKASSAPTEIHLRGERAEEAEEALVRFLDEAILAGLDQVRIVHGKGEGILRQMTREVLRKTKGIRTFRDGEPTEGGHGVTIAILR